MSTLRKMVRVGKSPIDFARCLNEAAAIYRANFVVLLLAAILFDVLSVCTLTVLSGPLCGGIVIMCLRAMRDPGRPVQLGDLFSAFDRFWSLVGLFYLMTIIVLLGFAMLLVPGLILTALFMFPTYLMIDGNMGVIDAMKTSWQIVLRRGLWPNVLLAILLLALHGAPALIPYAGWVAGWFLAPLGWLVNTSAYRQEVLDQPVPGAGTAGAFPVIPIASAT